MNMDAFIREYFIIIIHKVSTFLLFTFVLDTSEKKIRLFRA